MRIAAYAAGLGEIGSSRIFLTPQFGPRQRLAAIITNAPFLGDSLLKGKICDHCMKCVKECKTNAISQDKQISFKVAGETISMADLDTTKCSYYHKGQRRIRLLCPLKFHFQRIIQMSDVFSVARVAKEYISWYNQMDQMTVGWGTA